MQVTIRGKRWNLVFSRLAKDDAGDCDAPTKKSKTIRIDHSLKKDEFELLRTILHECLHAADWDKDEDWIDEVSKDIAVILIKQHYHLCQPEKKKRTPTKAS